MYTSRNFKNKKEIKDAIARGEKITVYQPNGDIFGVEPPQNGTVALEGPHYPQPHKWYARGTLKDGVLVKIS